MGQNQIPQPYHTDRELIVAYLGQNFLINLLKNPPTVIFQKVEKKKKNYFKYFFYIYQPTLNIIC